MNTTKALPDTRSRIESGFATSIGNVRDKQEDRYLGGDRIIAVADGMGGLSRGDVAAETVIDTLSAITFTGTTVQARKEIRKALARASAKLAKSAQKKNASESGTTVVGAVLARGTAKNCWLVFHVGDSRLYSYEDGELTLLTTDHSIVQELVDSGDLTPAQARIDPRRSIVTRAIGTAVSAEPDFRLVEATGQLVMACSDGITDELDDEDIAWIIQQNADLELGELAQKLVDSALEVGGHDNATVVLARAIPDTMVTTREGSPR